MPALTQLVVGVVGARDLLVGDLNGSSDPFVQLTVLDAKGDPLAAAGAFKTCVAKRTLCPEWHESFTVGSRGFDLRLATSLRFMVFDFDGLKRDDVLGVVDVPLDLISCETEPMDDWYRIVKVPDAMASDAKGELHLTFSRPAAPVGRGKAKSVAFQGEGTSPNLLYVTIDSGNDLLPMDRNNSSDPLVKLSVVGQRHQTETVAKTLKPHWDERFAFLLKDAHTTLELLAEDEDRTINDFLGRAQLVLADVLVPNEEKVVTVTLLDKKLQHDKDRGTLKLRLLWVHDPDAESTTKTSKKKKETSILQSLKKSMRVSAPDGPYNSDDELNEEDDEVLDIESDDDVDAAALPPPPPGTSRLNFAVATIHRVEDLPPMDSLLFDKGENRKHNSGGIDVYVAAALSSEPEEFVRTRVRTKQGCREQLNANFRESLMLYLPDEKDNKSHDVIFNVMDWDPVGGDEVVGKFEVKNVEAVAKIHGNQPFWVNLYGAPVKGCSNSSRAAELMNENAHLASAYRGRLLLTLHVRAKSLDMYEAKHQKRLAPKLPIESFPESCVYRMRAHFVQAIGLPAAVANGKPKLSLVLSCGLRHIVSTRKNAVNGSVKWNETEESDKMLFPVDVNQVPDVFLYLCEKDDDNRVAICYKRFSAKELLLSQFEREMEWIPLMGDRAVAKAKAREEFTGKALVRMGFGPIGAATAQSWDQKEMLEHVNHRKSYQVRVRLHEARNLVSLHDNTKTIVASATIQCWDGVQKTAEASKEQKPSTSPVWAQTFCIDVNLPDLRYAPHVLIHVRNESPREYIGTAAVKLSDAIEGSSADGSVTVCTSHELKQNERPRQPKPKWLPVFFNGDDGETFHGQVLASVELVRKAIPDETLPEPEELEEAHLDV
ncbi:Synaptotagmin-6 [Phytophthora pseudosyringae]|uniref:Synaptotagmin-6 n=1 Tax=Phytophthora pseudosyringae TaxID=221518 RepID=A0A8T1VF04_9STRA|nr:Synaptotagmin-6 [Phytophthora pseudosyringae]